MSRLFEIKGEEKQLEVMRNKFIKQIKQNEENDCWEFKNIKIKYIKYIVYAYKYSYALFVGKIADNMEVHQSCGNNNCCNPSHLFLKKHIEQKYIFKNLNGDALTREEVGKIIILLNSNNSNKTIMNVFNINFSTLSFIKSGKLYF